VETNSVQNECGRTTSELGKHINAHVCHSDVSLGGLKERHEQWKAVSNPLKIEILEEGAGAFGGR
jgi:hypothetical protein